MLGGNLRLAVLIAQGLDYPGISKISPNMLQSGHAATKTPRSEQSALDRRDTRNIMVPEERVFFARTIATFDAWGSNDQKADYRHHGGARRFYRRGSAAVGPVGGQGR
jgi:hypothetical protein